MTSRPGTARSRNSAETRAAILEAARRQFTQSSYDCVGVRDLAAEVGVDKALVNRYFGSKEELFKDVIEGITSPQEITGSLEQIGEQIASDIVARLADNHDLDGLSLLLRSISSPAASQMVREALISKRIEPLAKALGGEEAEMRAGLAVALALGAAVLARLVSTPGFREPDPKRLEARMAAILQATLAP